MPNVLDYSKNRLFARYGHECELIEGDEEERKLTFCQKVRKFFISRCIISELHVLSSEFLRSQGAIMKEKQRHVSYYHYTIHPFSDLRHLDEFKLFDSAINRIIYRKWWEAFMVFVFMAQFTLVPLDMAFYSDPRFHILISKHKWILILNFTDLAVLMDILLNFITGYYEKINKEVVLKVSAISKHYLKTWFLLDLIGSLPTHFSIVLFPSTEFAHHSYDKDRIILEIISLLKTLRVFTFRSYLSRLFLNFNISNVNRLMSLLIVCVIFFIHLMTCVMVFLTDYSQVFLNISFYYEIESTNRTSFPYYFSPRNFTPLQRYASNMYFTAQIICGTGYPIPIINNGFSYIFILLAIFVSRILFIHWLSRITEVLQSRSSTNKYYQMERQLREYMRHRQLPEYMQRRLLTYYEFRFQKSYFRESEILNTLSGQLRQEIVMHSCRKLVENVEFFKNLPLALIIRIVTCLRSQVFLVNDVIVRAFTQGDCMFFIGTGTVAIFTASGHEICHLEDGDHFGEIALVMQDELRVASVVAVEVCELYKLDRNDFIRAIQPYPDLLDEIMRIAADRMEQTVVLDEYNRREIASRRLY